MGFQLNGVIPLPEVGGSLFKKTLESRNGSSASRQKQAEAANSGSDRVTRNMLLSLLSAVFLLLIADSGTTAGTTHPGDTV